MAKNLKDLLDEELMSLYQGGDYQAFEVLYYRHSGKVFEYLKKRSTEELSRDLTQTVFEKIHKSRQNYEKKYPFLPWLFTITRNTLFDHFKSAESKYSKKREGPEILELIPSPQTSSAAYDFSNLLEGINPTQKRAIELRYLSDWSFEQISEEIKTSPQNVRKLISRGTDKIRSILKQKGESHND
ncbi:MAG: hypothetical protein A4S09_06330 [Proteobacteria bacterium SG_bin7]|nr:MAG: hypothetical protein A4S09_06330 [Proteobacteria bacterium SG_bin7]